MENKDINFLFQKICEIEKDHISANDLKTVDYVEKYKQMSLPLGTPVLIMAINNFEFLQHWISIIYSGYVPIAISPSTKFNKVKGLIETFKIGALASVKMNKDLLKDITINYSLIGSYSIAYFKQNEVLTSPGEVVILTSGTSGNNTACVHSVSSLIRNAEMHNKALGIVDKDRQLIFLPLYYSFALVAQFIGSLISGCSFVIDGPPFTIDNFNKKIKDRKITVAAITPTIARNIINSKTQIEKIRVLSIGGDQLIPEDVKRIYAKNISEELYLTYGLTEAGPRVSTLAVHEVSYDYYDCVGLPFSEIKYKINKSEEDTVGELLIKSPTLLLRKIGENVVQPVDSEGYLHTGDCFELASNGLLKYKGRIRNFVIYKGEKVNLTNINQVVQQFPNISYANTILNKEKDELELEVCLRDKAVDFSLSNLRTYIKRNLQSFEVPKFVTVKESFDFKK
ncbi:AMP-binding protein [Acinetobacter sp. A47]|uniref:AMP-binding protein n=1 Tax=Acinetobacter sp. A47 TaxID=1561217 RepID=UPI000571F0C3|nr:AMP-binding protein [Acinetobacter sp. A47]